MKTINERLQAVAVAVAFTVTSSFFVNNKQSKANPALAIPTLPAFCVSTAFVGCVVIGTALAAGIIYTVYQKVDTQQFFMVAGSNTSFAIIISVRANSEGHALEKCKKHYGKQKVKVFSVRDSQGKVRWFCTDNLDFYP
jgi:chromate transport protein ChrA